MGLKLIKPDKYLFKRIKDYRSEYFNYGEKHINGSCGLAHYDDLDEWLNLVLSIEKDKLSRDKVHATTFFSVREEDNRLIGSIQIRHTLTDNLKRYGGHIGYGIRPSERMKGYGTEQLRLVLDVAKEMNIPKVMISCDKSNIGSAKVIKNNNGILVKEDLHNNEIVQIYWIDLTK